MSDLAQDLLEIVKKTPAVAGQLVYVIRKIEPVLPTVKLVVDDPAFARIVQQIQTLHDIEASSAKPPTPTPGFPTPATPPAGIGLSKAVSILDAVIYARRHPWVPFAAGAAVLLLIGGVGYKLGSRRR